MAKRPREASELERCSDVAAPSTPQQGVMPAGGATHCDGTTISASNPLFVIIHQQASQIQQQSNQIQQLISLNQQQSAQLQQQSHQIDRLLSSVGPSAANNPSTLSVDAVMEEFKKANAVVNAANRSTALHEFARAGHIAGIKALLAAGADPDVGDALARTPLHIAAIHDHGEAVRLLAAAAGASVERRDKYDHTPLLLAVSSDSDNHAATQALIEAGAKVNVFMPDATHRCSALHIAALFGNMGCVKALLAAHADVHATDKDGRTPFSYASSKAPLPIVELLLEAGSDIEASARGIGTPLIHAVVGEHTAVLSYLISKGANINTKKKDGKTALLMSVQRNKLESARILLEAGADVTIADNKGLTPAKAAMEREDSGEMLQLLLSGGVKREVSS